MIHFGRAHQLAEIKELVAREKQVRIVLIVQVTDDSPQHIWYIPGSDNTFIPSEKTREQLILYGKRSSLHEIRIEVVSYPVSPHLAKELSEQRQAERKKQLDTGHQTSIHVTVPISGAAVGLTFFTQLMDALSQKSPRFLFHVVAKTTSYTQTFLTEIT